MKCVSRLAVLGFVVMYLCVAFMASAAELSSLSSTLQKAEVAYAERYQEEHAADAISLYESMLADLGALPIQTQAFVLNRLSQLCYEATTFSEGDTPADRELFLKGKDYGFRSLRLNPAFAEAEGRNFGEAVSLVTDPAALHWAASNWGKLCGMNPIEGLLQQGKVLALFTQSVEVDPRYWGSSSGSSLGSLLIMSPSALGGDREAGLALIEQSIADAPSYLSNRVILAEYWGFTYGYFGQLTGIRDAELIERELNAVLEADIGEWPFWNRQAHAQARRLLDQLQEMQD